MPPDSGGTVGQGAIRQKEGVGVGERNCLAMRKPNRPPTPPTATERETQARSYSYTLDGTGLSLTRAALKQLTIHRRDTNTQFLRRSASFDLVQLALDGLVDAGLKPVAAQDRGHPAALAATRRSRIAAMDCDLFQGSRSQRDDSSIERIQIGARDAIALF